MPIYDHYQLLGIEQNADRPTIRTAYRRALRRYHPDANAGSRGGEQRLLQVITAGRVLCDPKKRAAYDRQLTNNRPPQPEQQPPVKNRIRLVDPRKILLGWQKILVSVNLSCKRFFTAEQACRAEARARQKPERSPPDFGFHLRQATNRNILQRYQRGSDGIFRKVSRHPRPEKPQSWQRKTALWILILVMLWRV